MHSTVFGKWVRYNPGKVSNSTSGIPPGTLNSVSVSALHCVVESRMLHMHFAVSAGFGMETRPWVVTCVVHVVNFFACHFCVEAGI